VVRFGLRGSVQIASAVCAQELSANRAAARRESGAGRRLHQRTLTNVVARSRAKRRAVPWRCRAQIATRPVESRALNSSLFAAAMSDSLAAPRPGMRASMPSLSWQKSRKCCQDQLQRPRAGRLAS
jgi:hypothetical protein